MNKYYNESIVQNHERDIDFYFMATFDTKYTKIKDLIRKSCYAKYCSQIGFFDEDELTNFLGNDFAISDVMVDWGNFFDNYVCKLLLEQDDPSKEKYSVLDSEKSIIIEKYFESLRSLLIADPLFLIQLPISKLNISLIEKYIPEIRNILVQIESIKAKNFENFEKYCSGQYLSCEEEYEMFRAFYLLCNYDNSPEFIAKQKRLAEYLIHFSKYYSKTANIFLLRFFFYEKCRKINLKDVNFFFVNIPDSEYIAGSQNFKSGMISINSMLLEKIDVESFTEDFIKLLDFQFRTLFHELRHSEQQMNKEAHKENDMSYSYAAAGILRKLNSQDYDINYYAYDIENDADIAASSKINRIVEEYNLNKKIEKIFQCSEDRQRGYSALACRKDLDGNINISSNEVNKKLDEYFKKNYNTLQDEYSQFRKFYHDDGTPKSLKEILTQSYEDCDDFLLGQFISRCNEQIDLSDCTFEEKLNCLKNYASLASNCRERIQNIAIACMMRNIKTSTSIESFDNSMDDIIPININYYINIISSFYAIYNDKELFQFLRSNADDERVIEAVCQIIDAYKYIVENESIKKFISKYIGESKNENNVAHAYT